LLNTPAASRCNACEFPRDLHGSPVLHLNPATGLAPEAPKPPAAPAVPVMKPSSGTAGLSASERKAREEEMAAKRQKKEAEKQRILAQ
ncbi:Uncharacterized protein SCF082_LOCUS31656, partial [Durusdinium trenchii]